MDAIVCYAEVEYENERVTLNRTVGLEVAGCLLCRKKLSHGGAKPQCAFGRTGRKICRPPSTYNSLHFMRQTDHFRHVFVTS
jgi:hypothetical protein